MTADLETAGKAPLQPGRDSPPPGAELPDCQVTAPLAWLLPFARSAPLLGRNLIRASHCPAHLAGVDDALLLVSELVTNAYLHGAAPIRLSARCVRTAVIFTIFDGGACQTSMIATMAAPNAQSGRGLALLEALSTDWGIHTHPLGKSVWFVLDSQEPFAPATHVNQCGS